MNNLKKLLLALCFIPFFTACEENDGPSKEEELTIRTNQFIYEVMSEMYLWNNEIPNLDPQAEKDSEDYFNKLRSKKDKWSIITDNAQELMDELNGTKETFGWELIGGRFSNEKDCFAIVKYVYPESPAYNKLQRGDIIVKINGKMITEEDLNKLIQKGSINVTLGKADNNVINITNKTVSLTSQKMDINPVLIAKTITKGAHKIGYLMYTSFIGNRNQDLEAAFNDFKSQGVTDLILDFRYNHGGDNNASTFMCSAIAPKSVAVKENVLSKEIWNPEVQKIFENDPKSEKNLYTYFENSDCNLDLPENSKLYILTTEETASASEYVAIALKPFMDVILVGSQTHGKYTSMYAFTPQRESGDGKYVPDTELANWLLLPVCSRYTNIDNYPNFLEGMKPDLDLIVEDELFNTLGDENEPLLAKAIEHITGQAQRKFRSTPSTFKFERIQQPLDDIRSNHIILNKFR